MNERHSATPEEFAGTVAEAIAAFDAANHAFGRFVTYTVRPHNEPVPPHIQTVRESLQEAAVLAPDATTPAGAAEFLTALRAARDALTSLLTDPSLGYPPDEGLAAEEPLEEAIELLEHLLE